MVESDSDIDIKDHEILQQAKIAINSELTAKSAKIYEKAYCHFMDWTRRNKIDTFDEYVFIAYFEYLSKDLKSTTLWTRYSTLKSTVSIKHKVDISKYTKLYALLKRKAEGYEAKKSKAFTTEEMKQFIERAPDNKYLLSKVICIFGIVGACRRRELHKLEFRDVHDLGSSLLVTIKDRKRKTTRKFTVTGEYYELCKKYINCRPKDCTTPSFFVNYLNGKCTVQNVGINKFGNMGKGIATYLNLPNPNLYTGHCFRRSSASVKHNGKLKTTKVLENYLDESVKNNEIVIANQTLNCIEYNQSTNSITIVPSTSSEGTASIINEGPQMPQLHFNNCTIQNVYYNVCKNE